MAGINYSTFSSWVQERNQKQGKESALTGAAAKPEMQWIETEISCVRRRGQELIIDMPSALLELKGSGINS